MRRVGFAGFAGGARAVLGAVAISALTIGAAAAQTIKIGTPLALTGGLGDEVEENLPAHRPSLPPLNSVRVS